jgi:hypothetical protein
MKNLDYNSLQFFFILINLKKYNYLQTKFKNKPGIYTVFFKNI